MNRSKASKHYQSLIEVHGTAEERRAGPPRPIGFSRPRSVEVRGLWPYGVESQTWEEWHEGDAE